MAEGIEIAEAYVTAMLKMPGVKRDAENAIGEAEEVADDSGRKAGKKWGVALAAGVAAAAAVVTAAVVGLYNVGGVFDDVNDRIRIGTGATGEALDGLVDVANRVASRVPADFSAIGATVADLNTRLGLSGDTLTTVASQYLEAGRMLGETVDVQTTTAAFAAFRVEGEDVSGALDTLFRVSQATGVGMNQLASTAVSSAGSLTALGFSFEEATALAGSLDKAGVDATTAFASMGRAVVNLARDGESGRDVIQRVIGEIAALAEAGDQAGATVLAADIFGQRGANSAIQAIRSGALAFDDITAAAGLTGDTILGLAAETSDFAESWQVVKNNARLAIEPISEAIFNLTGAGGGALAEFAQKYAPVIAGFFDQLLTALGPLVKPIGDLFAQFSPLALIMQVLGPLLPQIGAAFAMIAQPIGQVVSMIGGLAAQLLPMLLPMLVQLAGVVLEVVGAFLPLVGEILVALVPLIEVLIPIVLGLVEAILPLVSILIEALAPILTELLPLFGSEGIAGLVLILTPIIAALVPVFKLVADIVAGVVVPAVQLISDVLGGLIDFLMGVFTGDWDRAWSGIVDIFRGIWNGIVGIVEGGVNAAIGLINLLIDGANVAVTAMGFPPIAKIPRANFQFAMFEDGGLVKGGRGGVAGVIGEGRYDELILPLSPKVLGLLSDGRNEPEPAEPVEPEPLELDEGQLDRFASKVGREVAKALIMQGRMPALGRME